MRRAPASIVPDLPAVPIATVPFRVKIRIAVSTPLRRQPEPTSRKRVASAGRLVATLARAEARLLYVQADLEKTRAEVIEKYETRFSARELDQELDSYRAIVRTEPEAASTVGKWIAEDRINWKETVLEGIEKAPEAFIGLFTGVNVGKMIVKL